MKIRNTEDNPDSQFAAMPQNITPTGMELNPSTEPIEEPKKEEISLPNVTFIPANKTLYNLVQEQANMYLDTTSLENLVDLGVSRKGDSFAFKKLMALKEEREATKGKRETRKREKNKN